MTKKTILGQVIAYMRRAGMSEEEIDEHVKHHVVDTEYLDSRYDLLEEVFPDRKHSRKRTHAFRNGQLVIREYERQLNEDPCSGHE